MENPGIYVIPPYQSRPPPPLKAPKKKRHPGQRWPRPTIQPATIFTPQDVTLAPEIHFPVQTVFAPDRPPHPRFVNRFDSREILLVVDGSCINNGRHLSQSEPPSAGCSFMYKNGSASSAAQPAAADPITLPFLSSEDAAKPTGSVAFRLEEQGPTGEFAEHTSNRAKLQAVIAALQFRPWASEGWRRVVILTDLSYIVYGATSWLPRWVARRWRKPSRTRGSRMYANRDLWEEMQRRIDKLRSQGCEVSFWLVPGAGNHHDGTDGNSHIQQAKLAARLAARTMPEFQVERFTRLCGIML
ncbi:ribonuclease H [Naviculisporaceae sp. PSN 640]